MRTEYFLFVHHTTSILVKLSTWSFEHSGDISCSPLVNPSHTDESREGRNTCLWIYNYIYIFNIFNCDSLHARLNSHYKAWSYKKKKHKNIKAYRKSVQKEPTVKRCLLILELKPRRSQVKGKQSIGRESQSLAVQGKKLLIQTSYEDLEMVTKKISNLSE